MSRIAYEDLTVAERRLLEELKTETTRSIARSLILECRAGRKADRGLRATLAATVWAGSSNLNASEAVDVADALLTEIDKDGGK